MTHIALPALPTDTEIHAMAGVLTRRYGARAGELARHFVLEHETIGDEIRAALWSEVCTALEIPASPPTLY